MTYATDAARDRSVESCGDTLAVPVRDRDKLPRRAAHAVAAPRADPEHRGNDAWLESARDQSMGSQGHRARRRVPGRPGIHPESNGRRDHSGDGAASSDQDERARLDHAGVVPGRQGRRDRRRQGGGAGWRPMGDRRLDDREDRCEVREIGRRCDQFGRADGFAPRGSIQDRLRARTAPPFSAAQLVVCDLFGTLVLTDRPRPTHREAAKQLMVNLSCDYDTARRLVYPLYLGLATADREQHETTYLLGAICDRLGLAFGVDEVCHALWPILGNGLGDYYLRPGASDFLGRIRAAGHELRLLSNCILPAEWMMKLLAEVGLGESFHACHFSSSGRGKKPHLRFFRMAGDGAFDTRWMLGDLVELDLEPAARLGWRTVLVNDEVDLAETATAILDRTGATQ